MKVAGRFQVQTFSGELVDLQNPDPKTINIDDIAISLARQYRFNGHTTQPYSVADHSVCVARYVAKRHGAEYALHALLHDAHEAYFGDIVSPAQRWLGEFMKPNQTGTDEIEGPVQNAIHAAFGCKSDQPWFTSRADLVALMVEQKRLFAHRHDWQVGDKLHPFQLDEEAEMHSCFEQSLSARWETSERQFRETFAIYRESR